MSGFQLRDIFVNNFNYDSIKLAIIELVASNTKYMNMSLNELQLLANEQKLKEEKEKKDEEDLKKLKECPPSYSVEKLLKDNNANEAIKKVKEHNISREEFWALTEENLKELLEIKTFGTRKNLLTVMAEIKLEHEKQIEKDEKDKKIKSRDAIIELIK